MNATVRASTAVIVVAAGSGQRLNADQPKAFVAFGGATIVGYALRSVVSGGYAQVIVVVPPDYQNTCESHLRDFFPAQADIFCVVTGADTRQESVRAGLAHLDDTIETVLIHDAARPLVPTEVFDRVCAAVVETGAGVIPVMPVADSLKNVDDTRVVGIVNRDDVVAVQTPQGFPRRLLEQAYGHADQHYTDDAAVVAAIGGQVSTVPGDANGFKITTMSDLLRARALVEEIPAEPRIGVGTDAHAFSDTGSLWLAGIEWPEHRGLSGHSDGDAVCHAIVDALLQAAGLGDIGSLFGTDDPQYFGAHSEVFLRRTSEILRDAGWRIGNVSVQLQMATPRFSPRRAEAEAVLSAALGGARVTVAATTTDGLGFVGRGEGVSVSAVALVFPQR